MSSIDYLYLCVFCGLLLISMGLSYFLYGKKIKESLKRIASIYSIASFVMLRSYAYLKLPSKFSSPISIFIDILISFFVFAVVYLIMLESTVNSGKKKD